MLEMLGIKKKPSATDVKIADSTDSVNGQDGTPEKGHSIVLDYSRNGKHGLTKGYLHTDLGQGYQNVHLYRDFHMMDQRLLEALGGTFKQFAPGGVVSQTLFNDMSWESIIGAFTKSLYFIQKGGVSAKKNPPFTAYDVQLHRSFRNLLRTNERIVEKHMQAAKGKVIQDAKNWFASFVEDPDVNNSIQLNFADIAESIANVQKAVDGPDGRAITRDENDQHEEVFLDIGVLRFPDFEKPFVKVYRLKLIAWTEYNVKAMRIRSGLRGEFNSCKYAPRKEFLATFQPQLLEEARKLAMGLLSGASTGMPA